MGDEAEVVDMEARVAEMTQPQVQKAVAVPPQVLAECIEILSTELPMKRVRGIVQMLEQCPIMDVTPSK